MEEVPMTSEFARQNSEHGLQVTDFGMKWASGIAEQSFNQTKIALVGFWKISKKIADDLEKQSSAVRQHSIAFAEKTFLNTLDFAEKWLSAKEPSEFIQLQSEFISRQAQVLSERTQELGEEARQAAQQAMLGVYDRVLESARRGEGEHPSKAEQPTRRSVLKA
jgi:hypothetical protein